MLHIEPLDMFCYPAINRLADIYNTSSVYTFQMMNHHHGVVRRTTFSTDVTKERQHRH